MKGMGDVPQAMTGAKTLKVSKSATRGANNYVQGSGTKVQGPKVPTGGNRLGVKQPDARVQFASGLKMAKGPRVTD